MKRITNRFIQWGLVTMTAIALMSIESCKKSSSSGSTTPPPVVITPLGGYVSSDSVAYANLVGYFNFNNNVNDSVGGETGTAVGVTYVPGVRGEAYEGATGAYATVPASAAVKALQSFSVSIWYSLPSANRPVPDSNNAEGIFFVSGSNTGSHGDEIIMETDVPDSNQYAKDSLVIHSGLDDIGSPQWEGFVTSGYDTAQETWVHLVETYNAGTSAYTLYINANPVAVGSAFGNSAATILYDGPLPVGSGTPATQLLGAPVWAADPPSTLYIGAWPPGLYGVSTTLGKNGGFKGALDELRIFNVELTPKEVTGLFLNGQAGR
jgi:Concanavalin A-like lectin/glucanases superfamily